MIEIALAVLMNTCPAMPDSAVDAYLEQLSTAKFAAIQRRNVLRRQLQTLDLSDTEETRIRAEMQTAVAEYSWLGDLWNHCINTRMRANFGRVQEATAALSRVTDDMHVAIAERERRRQMWRRIWVSLKKQLIK